MRLLLVASLALLTSCAERECDTFCRYKNALVKAVATADRIVVSEHASGYELMELQDQKSYTWQPGAMTIYRERELTPHERGRLLKRARLMPAKEPEAYAACVPEFHHSLIFYSGQSEGSRLYICFHCGQTEWRDVNESAPEWELLPVLARTIRDAGFETGRDWKSLAKAAANNEPTR